MLSLAIPIFRCNVVAVSLRHLTGSLLVNIPRLYLRYTRDVRYIGDILMRAPLNRDQINIRIQSRTSISKYQLEALFN